MSVIKDFDCEITEHCESGMCLFFDKGKGTTVAFRTDMDALPVTEVNDIPFKSVHDGKMHACGHDGHMSMALELARYVNENDTKHNILIVFQPSEETIGGAKEICDSGIFREKNTIAMFGIHMWPFGEPGEVISKPGVIMSRFSIVRVGFTGVASHATQPEKGVNALHAACMFLDSAYEKHAEICKSEIEGEDKTIMSLTMMNGGTAFNIIPNETSVSGCIRAFRDDRFDVLKKLIEDSVREGAEKVGAGYNIEFSDGYPAVYNDEDLYAKISSLDITDAGDPILVSEDFSFYGKEVPSVLFLLGTGTGIALHADNFNFDESVLLKGVELYINLIELI